MTETNIPGVVQGSNAKNYYWSIFDGKLARKATSESEPGAVSRINKKNVKVHEIFAAYGLKGIIRDVNIFENIWDGKKVRQLVIKLVPQPGTIHVINVPKESRYFGSFLEKLNNINVKQEIEINSYNFENEDKPGKKNVGFSIKQIGNKIGSYYKVKNGEKWEYLHGYPPFPAGWNDLSEREKKNYFWDVDEFLEKAVQDWRLKFAPDYQKEKEAQEDADNSMPEHIESNFDELMDVPPDNDPPF